MLWGHLASSDCAIIAVTSPSPVAFVPLLVVSVAQAPFLLCKVQTEFFETFSKKLECQLRRFLPFLICIFYPERKFCCCRTEDPQKFPEELFFYFIFFRIHYPTWKSRTIYARKPSFMGDSLYVDCRLGHLHNREGRYKRNVQNRGSNTPHKPIFKIGFPFSLLRNIPIVLISIQCYLSMALIYARLRFAPVIPWYWGTFCDFLPCSIACQLLGMETPSRFLFIASPLGLLLFLDSLQIF